jgi:hypothetical protein
MINFLKKFCVIAIGSNLIVIFAMFFLPVFLITDQVDVFNKLIFYISKY